MKTEEMDCGGFFDNIDDFLDVPNDDDVLAASSLPPIDLDSFPGIWSDVMTGNMQESSFPCSDSVFSNSDISAKLSVPYEDIVQMEWLSSFVEDSFSAGDGSGSSLTINMPVKDSPEKQWFDHRFRTPSPVSVLDSSSSCSTEKTSNAVAPSRCGRARTKRPRPTTANFRPVTTPPPPLALVSPASESSVESRLMIEISNHNKKKKKIKFTLPAAPAPGDGDSDLSSHPIRKCQHCEITKTPQWRAGPMGPKTLCNACGVRYKSGRLFPEYRPAASPTFVPTVHSNSHKKVLEMRNKTDGRALNGGGSPLIELITSSRVEADYV